MSEAWVAESRGFGEYLDALPATLVGRYVCKVRGLTDAELRRLHGAFPKAFSGHYAVQPDDPDSASLLVARYETAEGVPVVTMGFGIAAQVHVPVSIGDPPNVNSALLIGEAEWFIDAVTHGCTEFCRPYERTNWLDRLHPGSGPWFEQGWEADGRGEHSKRGPDLCEPFERRWQPWPPMVT